MSELFLIVDNDAESTFLARRNLLQAFPLATIEDAPNGFAALETLRQRDFTAVITDYCMPRMDGLTFVRKIRELGLPVPIVMRTAMENLEGPALAAGADCVLPWFRWGDLGDVVKEVLHLHPSGHESSA